MDNNAQYASLRSKIDPNASLLANTGQYVTNGSKKGHIATICLNMPQYASFLTIFDILKHLEHLKHLRTFEALVESETTQTSPCSASFSAFRKGQVQSDIGKDARQRRADFLTGSGRSKKKETRWVHFLTSAAKCNTNGQYATRRTKRGHSVTIPASIGQYVTNGAKRGQYATLLVKIDPIVTIEDNIGQYVTNGAKRGQSVTIGANNGQYVSLTSQP